MISSNGAMPQIGLADVWFCGGERKEDNLELGVWHVTLRGASYSTGALEVLEYEFRAPVSALYLHFYKVSRTNRRRHWNT